MYKVFALFFLTGSMLGCSNADPVTTDLLTNHYPGLYTAVFERDAASILEYTQHDSTRVAQQAWQAMINTPVEDVSSLIDRAAEANTSESWASLWFKELSEDDLTKLHDLWNENSDMRTGIASVLGYHGNMNSLEMLLTSDMENPTMALAVGRLSGSLDITKETEQEIVQKAFASEDPKVTTSYLYGFYRTLKDLDPETEELMIQLWENYYPEDKEPVQYLVRILMKNHMDKVIFHFEMDDFEWMEPQMAVEVARGIGRNPLTRQSAIVLNALLDNRNVNVRIEALRAIQAKQPELEGQHDRAVLNKIGLIRGYQSRLRLEALNAVTNPGRYREEVYSLSEEDPYLMPLKYEILSKFLSDKDLLTELKSDLNKESRLFRFYALQQLAGWWSGAGEKSDSLITEVRILTTDYMKTADRSMIFTMGSLFRDSLIIRDTDFPLMENMMDRFQLPEDVEVFQAVSSVLKDRFEEQATPLINELAEQGNTALNQTLIDQGWNIPEPEESAQEFRSPDWKRLSRLGPDPILVLQTQKGEIFIRMDVLSAPATIAGIDELIEKRAYNSVPFHRVIPNFVIQGGDVETQDGFGGPDYVVPTEATSTEFYRGKVGIASAGRDTEGSQYFIMHQWMPHLTGLYSIVGEVVEGMDVADRIVMGDYVERAYWD